MSYCYDKEQVRWETKTEREEKQWHQLTSQVQDVVITLLQFNVSLLANTHTHTPSLFHSLTANVSLLANTHTHTFIVSQLNSQCLAPGKHTGFQCFTITFNVSWQTHTEAFIVSVFNIQCLTAGKHIDRLSLFQCLTQCLAPANPKAWAVTIHWHRAVS